MTRWASMGGTGGAAAYRPDWVMVGVPDPKTGGVFVFASDKLTHAQLTARYHTAEWSDGFRKHFEHTGGKTYVTELQSVDMVVAAGRDYPEALANLMEFWKPKPRAEYEQPALNEQRRQIEGP